MSRLTGLDPMLSTPQEFTQYLKKEIATWAKVAKQAGARAE
jgi:tripartite-type tricarboxylate transporter receptor subunit TctC